MSPEDRLLLGMRWRGRVYVDACLPFGLRSAPLIFTALADGLEWIVRQQGVHFIYHYLDNYIMLGAPGTMECHSSMHKLVVDCWKHLGVPLAQEKSEKPTSCLTFLGIEVDTEQMQLHLPAEKLQKACSLIKKFLGIPSALNGIFVRSTPACVKSSKARKEFCETSNLCHGTYQEKVTLRQNEHGCKVRPEDQFLVEWNGRGGSHSKPGHSGSNVAHRCVRKLGLCGSDREKLVPIGMEREGQRMAYSG